MEEKNLPVGGGEEARSPPSRARDGGKGGPPEEVIYDNGQIFLDLLRGRSEEEDKRRIDLGLRRGPDDAPAAEDL